MLDKIVIVGGGIGGLTTALAMLKRGLNVEVHEQASELREVIRLDEEPVSKTGGGFGPLASSSLAASASLRSGSWSNRKILAPHARDSGAIPDESTSRIRGPVA